MPPSITILNTMSCLATGDIDIQHWHWYAMMTPVCSLFFLALVWEKYCAAIYFVCNVHFKSIKPRTVCAYNIPRICFTMFTFVSINEAVDYWTGHKRILDAFIYTFLNAYLFIHVWVRTYSYMFECVLIPGLTHGWMRLSRTQRDHRCLYSYMYESREFQTTGRVQGFVSVRPVNCFSFQPSLWSRSVPTSCKLSDSSANSLTPWW